MRAALTNVALIFVLVCLSTSGLFAQEQELIQSPLVRNIDPAPPIVPDSEYQPLTLGKKYSDSLTQIFGVPQLAVITVRTTMDQLNHTPAAWGTGTGAFTRRFAARFGKGLVHENIAFGVRAVGHEDPRYFRSGKGSFLKRTRYSTVSTFWVHNDDGSMMPAYSRFFSDYTTPFIERHWLPVPFTARQGLKAGTLSLGIGTLVNFGQEFWPDLQKKLSRRIRREP